MKLKVTWSNLKKIKFFSNTLMKIDKYIKNHPEILTTAIPYASDIERMGLERQPLGGFTNKGKSINAYHELWQEVMMRVDAE